MREKRAYYYLVAGLPDLVPDQPKAPLSPAAFLEELREHLHPDDFRTLDYLRLPIDNNRLLAILQKLPLPEQQVGLFAADILQDALRNPDPLPQYMQIFLQAYQQQEPLFPDMSWQNQLSWCYFDEALRNSSGFIHDWLQFDRNLRNLLTGISCRRHKRSTAGQLIGDYPLTAAIHHSQARDFGLGMEFPLLNKILPWDDLAWLSREKSLDVIRWHYLDDLTTFDYFSLEWLMAYFIRLGILQRWEGLHPAEGQAALRQMIRDFDNSIQFKENHA
jgi:hypothetical protein